MMDKFTKLSMNVIAWSCARQIIPNSTPTAQLLKAFEEMGELASATAKQRNADAKDAIGDVLVCLINYCTLKGFTMEECLEQAWNEIKDRTGHMNEQGVFVKD